jgi:hypothetical protein
MPGVEIFERADLAKLAQNPPNLIFKTAVEFSEFIETLAKRDSTTLTSVLVDFCEVYDLEYETLAKMLTVSLKDKVSAEMQDAGLLPKSTRLEFEED